MGPTVWLSVRLLNTQHSSELVAVPACRDYVQYNCALNSPVILIWLNETFSMILVALSASTMVWVMSEQLRIAIQYQTMLRLLHQQVTESCQMLVGLKLMQMQSVRLVSQVTLPLSICHQKKVRVKLRILVVSNRGLHGDVDESGYTVCQRPTKVIAKKGRHSVGQVTSAEKGKTVTAVCCASATGLFVPPMLIFPRARMKPSLMDGAPTGAVAEANKSVWINEAIFTKWFQHFIAIVQPQSRPQPVVVLMDGHNTHTVGSSHLSNI